MKPLKEVIALALLGVLTLTGCSGKAVAGNGTGRDADGVLTAEGVSDDTITLGLLTDMTGVYAAHGKSITQAQQLWAQQTNRAGGICGRKIELLVRDHGYDAQRAMTGYTELEPKVLGFPQFMGSPFVAAVRDRIDREDKVLVVPQAWSASLLGGPYIRTVGTTYDIDAINAVDYLIAEKRVTKGDKVGHVYFEGDFGENAVQGSTFAAKRAGLTIVEQKIKPVDGDMTSQVTALKRAGVSAVLLSVSPRQTASFVSLATANGLRVPVMGAASSFAPQLLTTTAGPSLVKDFYVTSSSLPISAPAPGPERLSKAYAAAYPKDPVDNGASNGYQSALVFEAALKKACTDKDLTRDGLSKALRSITAFNGGFGSTHDFSDPAAPSTRQSMVLKPDKNVPGGLKVIRPAKVSEAANTYAPAFAGH
ncbi:ABC transporter substrate-binding protein [Streptomyces sp. NPDC058548]|uniref:ABC transporter substrate-binding protein n=1 Tax=unclassified Streptomyces TaxID=2593676 RepID=UPI0036648EC5